MIHLSDREAAVLQGGLTHKRERKQRICDQANQGPDSLAAQCVMVGLDRPQREHRFHPTRLWRFDLAWPERRFAVEVDGGTWANMRHTRGSGWIKDQEKLNEAAILGWRVLHVTPEQVENGEAIALVERGLR